MHGCNILKSKIYNNFLRRRKLMNLIKRLNSIKENHNTRIIYIAAGLITIILDNENQLLINKAIRIIDESDNI